jgi:hypothetical protein
MTTASRTRGTDTTEMIPALALLDPGRKSMEGDVSQARRERRVETSLATRAVIELLRDGDRQVARGDNAA